MAGHSKWANIRRHKESQDKKKGKIFSKLIREITVAARSGGDPSANPRLRLALDKAYSHNMAKDTVEKAIKRGVGGDEGKQLEEVIYEGYGTNGVALMVIAMTDNRNRTASDVRHAFTKGGGNLGTEGSVAYLFKEQGILEYPAGSDESKIFEQALEAGAEDVITNDDGSVDVVTAADKFMQVKTQMEKIGLKPQNAELTRNATIKVPLTDREAAEKMLRLVDTLEELDDVQEVYSNADIPDEILQKL